MKQLINPLTGRFDMVNDNDTPVPCDVTSVNGQTGVVILDTDDISDTDAENKFVSESEKKAIGDINTKAFGISDNQDTPNAQAAYEWYSDGNNPIIIYNNYAYVLADATASRLTFRGKIVQDNQNSSSCIWQSVIYFDIQDDNVQTITIDAVTIGGSFIRLGQNYNTPFSPTEDGDPTSKKYVDEHGPCIPVYATHGSITGTKTFNVFESGTYRIILEGTRGGITNRNITISADSATVATYTAAYAGLLSITTTVTATTTIGLTFDTDITISDIIIDKINIQQGIISDNIS